VCFLISDFLTEDSLLALSRLAGLHDLTCVLMDHEPLDGALMTGGTGVVLYRDVETKEIIEVDTSNKRTRTELEDCHRQWQLTIESAVLRSGADLLRVQSEKSVVDPLMEYLKKHKSNRPRRAL
jgi:hypothetical protein